MEYLLVSTVLALWGGSIWAAVSYTRKAIEAAQQVKLAEQKPQKRAYVRKKKPAASAASGVVAATMTPATGLTEGAKQALNGAYLYPNGHADSPGEVSVK